MLRFFTIGFVALVAAVVVAAAIGPWAWWVVLALLVMMLAIGVYDPTQRRHSVLPNYLALGLFEPTRYRKGRRGSRA